LPRRDVSRVAVDAETAAVVLVVDGVDDDVVGRADVLVLGSDFGDVGAGRHVLADAGQVGGLREEGDVVVGVEDLYADHAHDLHGHGRCVLYAHVQLVEALGLGVQRLVDYDLAC